MIAVRACLRLPSLNTCDNIGSYKTDETLNEQQQVNCCSSLHPTNPIMYPRHFVKDLRYEICSFVRLFVCSFARSFVCLFV